MAKTGAEWEDLYMRFESMYNQYPTMQMSRAEAFRKALDDGLITYEEYKDAREYYDDLWYHMSY